MWLQMQMFVFPEGGGVYNAFSLVAKSHAHAHSMHQARLELFH